MEKGSVYKAKYQMQWAGLILLVMPWATYQICDRIIENRTDFWTSFIIIGFIWTIMIYSYVVGRIWKKIRQRHIEIVVSKIVNYHFICIKSIANSDWGKVRFVLDKSLSIYDSSSPVTYFIKGAYTVGTNDINALSVLADEIEKIKNENISRL